MAIRTTDENKKPSMEHPLDFPTAFLQPLRRRLVQLLQLSFWTVDRNWSPEMRLAQLLSKSFYMKKLNLRIDKPIDSPDSSPFREAAGESLETRSFTTSE